MAYVFVGDGGCNLDFDGDDLTALALDDEVDLVVTIAGSEVEVAETLAYCYPVRDDPIVAGRLHDVVEDTSTAVHEVRGLTSGHTSFVAAILVHEVLARVHLEGTQVLLQFD